MKKIFLYFSLILMLSITVEAALTVDIYDGHSIVGGGAPFSNLVGSFISPDIMFATNTGYNWHPFGLGDFGAEISGCLRVATDGLYSFTLNSDDGSILYIDNVMVVNNGGAHSPAVVSGSTNLTAGAHLFKVEFFEDYGGPSGVDLILPQGVGYCTIPAPGAIVLGVMGTSLVGWLRRRRSL